MKRNAQTISTDALIAVALFLIVITFFFSLSTDTSNETKVRNLQSEVTKLLSSISGTKNSTGVFVSGSKVSESKLAQMASLTYGQLKDELGVQADFCIYFEDEDDNIIAINDNVTALGSRFVTIGGTLCGGISTAEKIICEEAESTGKCSSLGDLGLTRQQCCAFAKSCCP